MLLMASTPSKRGASKSNADGPTVSETFSKAFTANAVWADKDEFLDVIYWMRQILGLVIGILWGLLNLKGMFGLALFFLVNVGIVYLYYSSFQKVDEEEYGGSSEILKEGLVTSFSSFLVAWILLHSALNVET